MEVKFVYTVGKINSQERLIITISCIIGIIITLFLGSGKIFNTTGNPVSMQTETTERAGEKSPNDRRVNL